MKRVGLEKATLTINLIDPTYRGVILLAAPHNATNAAVYILGVDVTNSNVSISYVGGTSGHTPSASYNDKTVTITFNSVPWGAGFIVSTLGDFTVSQHSVSQMKTQYGRASVTPVAETVVAVDVVFDKEFSSIPTVVAIQQTAVPNKTALGINNISTSGFTIQFYRTDNTKTAINWIAVGAQHSVSPLINDGVVTSQTITARPTEGLSLSTSYAKIVIDAVYNKSGSEEIFTLEDGGVKCAKAGKVLVSANTRFMNTTDGDLVGVRLYRDNQLLTSAYGTRVAGASALVAIPSMLMNATEGGIFYLYACNETAARGNIANGGVNLLTIQYVG